MTKDNVSAIYNPFVAKTIANSRYARIGKLMKEEGKTYAEAAAIVDKDKGPKP